MSASRPGPACTAIIVVCQQDVSNNPKYVHNNDYFYDGGHLNARGADEFTRDLVVELKKRGIVN